MQRLNEILATIREPQGEDDTPEKLEAERQAAQDFIDTGTRHFGVTPYLR
jgi:SWI/SNF-related matrix-associated actin-dependent regulator of chromatin subfamily A member 5